MRTGRGEGETPREAATARGEPAGRRRWPQRRCPFGAVADTNARWTVTTERVGLIEPDDRLRSELSQALSDRGFEVALEAADPVAGIQGSRRRRLDVVVVGVPLPSKSMSEVLHSLWSSSPRALTVVHGKATAAPDAGTSEIADASVPSWRRPSDLAEAVAALEREHHHAASFVLADTVGAAGDARVHLRSLARRWGRLPAEAEAELVLSELVTNAFRHGRAPIELRVSLTDSCLRLVVSDHGSSVPVIVPPWARDSHGRGLVLVEALARSWGCVARPDGKDVWVVLGGEKPA